MSLAHVCWASRECVSHTLGLISKFSPTIRRGELRNEKTLAIGTTTCIYITCLWQRSLAVNEGTSPHHKNAHIVRCQFFPGLHRHFDES
ncbi:hypothetical protein FIBSPDRAFT_569648 [Athelia psychrophila]|uniref:Uncharacterized protein n=1 Tax=Athelia psychrophila TaxID=1759441 RepID=A0A166HPZ2_9AGAM|nr:hypothetical protein FIBSPDRAFT_569648 [Fibularhizoctonia sp. CBS 109695]